jgi:hypothetical protein
MKTRILSRLSGVCFLLATVEVALLIIDLLFPFGKPRRTPHPETFAHVILRLVPWLSAVLLIALGFCLQRFRDRGGPR